MLDRGGRRSADGRRQRRGEDEAWRIGTHRIDQRARAGDVAAKATERLGERAFDHVDTARDAVALADAAAARAVHADSMHLVDISHGAVALGEIADAVHRRDVAVHGIQVLAPVTATRAPLTVSATNAPTIAKYRLRRLKCRRENTPQSHGRAVAIGLLRSLPPSSDVAAAIAAVIP